MKTDPHCQRQKTAPGLKISTIYRTCINSQGTLLEWALNVSNQRFYGLCANDDRRRDNWTYRSTRFSLSRSPDTLVFNTEFYTAVPNGALKRDWVSFRLNISETVKDIAEVTKTINMKSRTRAVDWHQLRWPSMTLNSCNEPLSRYFKLCISEPVV